MKKYYLLTVSILTISLLSCHSHSDSNGQHLTDSAGMPGIISETPNATKQMDPSDTIGFGAFKAEQQKKYDDSVKLVGINEERRRHGQTPLVGSPSNPSTLAPVADSTNMANNTNSTSNSSVANNSGTSNNGSAGAYSQPTVKKKKGMSNATKGALIGGGAGALTGALVTKHNRGIGALIGAAAGGGAGYLIGHSKDKKQGN